MALVFRLKIGTVEYGPTPLGNGALKQVTLEPAGPGGVGLASFVLKADAGAGYTITDKMEVEFYEWDTTTSEVTWSIFGGFVSHRQTSVVKGTDTKVWIVDCQDQNLLMDKCVAGALLIAEEIVVGSATLATQIADIVNTLTTGAAKAINATTFVQNLTGATALPFKSFMGRSLRSMFREVFNEARIVNSALRPDAYIAPSKTVPRASFGGPHVYVFDRAATPTPVVKLTDTPGVPSADYKGIRAFDRDLDGASLVTRRDAKKPEGGVFRYTEATAVTTYPNPYMAHSAWMQEPATLPTGLTDVQAQAAIERDVKGTAYTREALTVVGAVTLTGTERVLPGEFVSITWAAEGLSDTVYPVAGERIDFDAVGHPTITLSLGNRKLEIGEVGDDLPAPPIEQDNIGPDAPTNNDFLGQNWEAGLGLWRLDFDFDVSTASDVSYYLVTAIVAGRARPEFRIDHPTNTYYIYVGRGLAWETYVEAYDGSGNVSPPSNSETGTTPISHWLDRDFNFDKTSPLGDVPDFPTVATTGTGSSGAPSTAEVYKGDSSLAITLTTTNSSRTHTSLPVPFRAGDALALHLARKGSTTNGTAIATLQWFDKSDVQIGADVTVWSAAPTTAFVPNDSQHTAPANTVYYKLKLAYSVAIYGGGSITLYWAPPVGGRAADIFDTNFDIGDKNLQFWHGTIHKGQISLNVSNDYLRFSSLNSGGTTKARLEADTLDYIEVAPSAGTTFKGGVRYPFTSTSTDLTLDWGYHSVVVNASGAARNINLPTAVGIVGREYRIKKVDSSANAVKVNGFGGTETIDGAITYTMTAQYDSVIIESDGTNWHVMAKK